jgi:tRNA-2-methylthio-N6-dimethylallyladenosine synthase
MKNKYLYIQTFGCQMNVHDSEQMAALLADIGYKTTNNKKLADLILLNTCSIREIAAQKLEEKNS